MFLTPGSQPPLHPGDNPTDTRVVKGSTPGCQKHLLEDTPFFIPCYTPFPHYFVILRHTIFFNLPMMYQYPHPI